MAIWQHYYTHGKLGLNKKGGWETNACSLAIIEDSEFMNQISTKARIEVPEVIIEKYEDIKKWPIKLDYYIFSSKAIPVINNTVPLGGDEIGRGGRYFSHSIIFSDGERELDMIEYLPIEFWDWQGWAKEEVEDNVLPDLDYGLAEQRKPRFRLDVITDSFFNPEKKKYNFDDNTFVDLMTNVLKILNEKKKSENILLLGNDTGQIASWIGLICFCLPKRFARKITFSTFSNDPHETNEMICGYLKEDEDFIKSKNPSMNRSVVDLSKSLKSRKRSVSVWVKHFLEIFKEKNTELIPKRMKHLLCVFNHLEMNTDNLEFYLEEGLTKYSSDLDEGAIKDRLERGKFKTTATGNKQKAAKDLLLVYDVTLAKEFSELVAGSHELNIAWLEAVKIILGFTHHPVRNGKDVFLENKKKLLIKAFDLVNRVGSLKLNTLDLLEKLDPKENKDPDIICSVANALQSCIDQFEGDNFIKAVRLCDRWNTPETVVNNEAAQKKLASIEDISGLKLLLKDAKDSSLIERLLLNLGEKMARDIKAGSFPFEFKEFLNDSNYGLSLQQHLNKSFPEAIDIFTKINNKKEYTITNVLDFHDEYFRYLYKQESKGKLIELISSLRSSEEYSLAPPTELEAKKLLKGDHVSQEDIIKLKLVEAIFTAISDRNGLPDWMRKKLKSLEIYMPPMSPGEAEPKQKIETTTKEKTTTKASPPMERNQYSEEIEDLYYCKGLVDFFSELTDQHDIDVAKQYLKDYVENLVTQKHLKEPGKFYEVFYNAIWQAQNLSNLDQRLSKEIILIVKKHIDTQEFPNKEYVKTRLLKQFKDSNSVSLFN